ncbi:hypothetical protein NW762_013200 [Fusarium torreyae]|uniref:Uncharacterized protein n=1 Tax=Fusarium torreyae TaxID=1237075 RepID=A0A9W8RP58_9HYPO|nr:hypothetical protein NW762_013200 [Fusarium torreyae]
MGHSAGGISCYLHLLQVELGTERSLFRKVGVISGPVGCLDLSSLEKADQRWADLCQLWSIQVDNPVDRLDILRRIPTWDLLDSISELRWGLFSLIIDESTIRKSNLGCGVTVHLHDGLADEAKPSNEKVQVMISAADDEFRSFALMANWSYTEFKSLLTSSYPSEEAAQGVLQAYGILPTSSDEELFEASSQFISDTTMMYKVYCGYEFLKCHRGKEALLRDQDPKRVGVQYDHFEIGNPFPGPMQGIAHHGIELVYAFGNFQNDLERADQGISQGCVDPDQAHAEPNVNESSVSAKSTEYCKSNIDLSYELQDRWIQFVVEDCHETDQRANADGITTFCHDRSVRAESWSSGEKWLTKRKKLEILGNDHESITTSTRRLVGSVLGAVL